MTDAEAYPFLTEIFHDVFMRDDIVLTPATSAPDIETWDSFKQIEIIVAVQEALGIKFTTAELDRMGCVGDLAGFIVAKTGG